MQNYLFLIKGRHSAHVAAACLYIVSRERNKPHLLIDFADALHVNFLIKD
jgi:transcription factor IIIB subunit 2